MVDIQDCLKEMKDTFSFINQETINTDLKRSSPELNLKMDTGIAKTVMGQDWPWMQGKGYLLECLE